MKTKGSYITLLLILRFMISVAQIPDPEWNKQSGLKGCDFYTDVIEDANDGYTVTGALNVEGNSLDFHIIRFAPNGEMLWSKIMGNQNREVANRLIQLNDNSYVFTGTSYQNDVQQSILFRLDENGDKLWGKTLGEEYLNVADIIKLEENNFAIAGSKGEAPGNPKPWMAVMDANGGIIWEQTYMDDINGCVNAIKQLPNGDFILAAQVNEAGKNNCDVLAVRTSDKGETKWFARINTPEQKVWPECICCSADSCFMMVGWNGKCLNDINSADPIFDYDLVLYKINPDGEILWTKSVDREGSEGGNALTILSDETFIVAGIKATSFLGKVGPWLLAIDPEGNELNEKLLNLHFNNDHAARIINSSDGGFVVIGPGIQEETNTRSDGWLMKFNGL